MNRRKIEFILKKDKENTEKKIKKFDKYLLDAPFFINISKFFHAFLLFLFDIIKKIFKKDKESLHLFGIYGYFGLPGQGKTMSLSYKLLKLRQKYGDKIIIMTNYNFKYQDFAFTDWHQLLERYDKPVIVGWDEVQNDFNSREFKTFPIELLTFLTQNRKGNGVQIHYTAQRWDRVDKVFRELTNICYQTRTAFNRFTTSRGYSWMDYECILTATGWKQRARIHGYHTFRFVQTDFLRDCYNSFQMLDSAKDKFKDNTETIQEQNKRYINNKIEQKSLF